MISLLGPTVERSKHKATEFRLTIAFPILEPQVYAQTVLLYLWSLDCLVLLIDRILT